MTRFTAILLLTGGLGTLAAQTDRWGANYYLTPNVSFTAGYGYIKTYRCGSYPVTATFPEHRIWQ